MALSSRRVSFRDRRAVHRRTNTSECVICGDHTRCICTSFTLRVPTIRYFRSNNPPLYSIMQNFTISIPIPYSSIFFFPTWNIPWKVNTQVVRGLINEHELKIDFFSSEIMTGQAASHLRRRAVDTEKSMKSRTLTVLLLKSASDDRKKNTKVNPRYKIIVFLRCTSLFWLYIHCVERIERDTKWCPKSTLFDRIYKINEDCSQR